MLNWSGWEGRKEKSFQGEIVWAKSRKDTTNGLSEQQFLVVVWIPMQNNSGSPVEGLIMKIWKFCKHEELRLW